MNKVEQLFNAESQLSSPTAGGGFALCPRYLELIYKIGADVGVCAKLRSSVLMSYPCRKIPNQPGWLRYLSTSTTVIQINTVSGAPEFFL